MHNPAPLEPGQKLLKEGVARIGQLAISRTLGDRVCKVKQPMITALPDIVVTPVAEGDYIVLACDGLWDVMTNEEVVKFITERMHWPIDFLRTWYGEAQIPADEHAEEAGSDERLRLVARALRDNAHDLESSDNISVMIIKI